MFAESGFQLIGLLILVIPIVPVLCLGVPTLVGRPLAESLVHQIVHLATALGFGTSLIMLALMLVTGHTSVHVELGNWVSIPHYHFAIKFVFDRLSVPFVILTYLLCGIISAFASRYMDREPGENRFFVLYSLFLLGMIATTLAGTIETLFSGWELVGLSSALLVAFYHTRPSPVSNGLHVWIVYRLSDSAFVAAMVVMHHLSAEGDFEALLGVQSWPDGRATLTKDQALIVGSLLLLTAAGKSALVPFSGWLVRAMEGPTPSSAIFYGALSVHLGAFLLLRINPLLELSSLLCALIVTVGLLTAWYGTLVSRVQTDIKSALAFASLTQVGIIVAEIGFGFRYLALVHLLGHAFLRTLQFLRAPSALQDHVMLENAIDNRLPRTPEFWQRLLRPSVCEWLYRFALERGHLDSWLKHLFVRPVVSLFESCDRIDRRWNRWIAGDDSISLRLDKESAASWENSA